MRVILRRSHLWCLCTASVQWIIPPSSWGRSCCLSRTGDPCGIAQRTVCIPLIGIDRGMILLGICERFVLIVRRKHNQCISKRWRHGLGVIDLLYVSA